MSIRLVIILCLLQLLVGQALASESAELQVNAGKPGAIVLAGSGFTRGETSLMALAIPRG